MFWHFPKRVIHSIPCKFIIIQQELLSHAEAIELARVKIQTQKYRKENKSKRGDVGVSKTQLEDEYI